MTWKADIGSESAAAVLGGITSFIDMPNNSPAATTMEAIEWKLGRAKETSAANYGFHIGATNSNASLIREYIESGKGDRFGGIKVFMGSSTGNMLVDRENALEDLFRIKGKTILIHSEDEEIIKRNLENARATFSEDIPFEYHPLIRSREAHQAKKANPLITAETSANYLWFSDKDYSKMAGKLKCNPAVKAAEDREALIEALRDGTIDTIGSDHAPHLIEEKLKPYLTCPSGLPTIQQSLAAVLTIAGDHGIPLTRIASAFSERAAEIFGIEKRGFLKPGYKADIIAIDPDKEFIVGRPAYKCGWSPYEGMTMRGSIDMVWVNGRTQGSAAEPLSFRTN